MFSQVSKVLKILDSRGLISGSTLAFSSFSRHFMNQWVVCSTPNALSPNAPSPRALSPRALSPHALSTNGLGNIWKSQASQRTFFYKSQSKIVFLTSCMKKTRLAK